MNAERRPEGRRSNTRWGGGFNTNANSAASSKAGLFVRGAVPEIDALVEPAFVELGNTPFVCAHLARNAGAVAFGCSQHPRLGLMCGKCLRRHLPRHDSVSELSCDRCGDVADRIHGVVARGAAHALPVRRARGSRGLLYADVMVVGTGLCMPCHTATTMKDSA